MFAPAKIPVTEGKNTAKTLKKDSPLKSGTKLIEASEAIIIKI